MGEDIVVDGLAFGQDKPKQKERAAPMSLYIVPKEKKSKEDLI